MLARAAEGCRRRDRASTQRVIPHRHPAGWPGSAESAPRRESPRGRLGSAQRWLRGLTEAGALPGAEGLATGALAETGAALSAAGAATGRGLGATSAGLGAGSGGGATGETPSSAASAAGGAELSWARAGRRTTTHFFAVSSAERVAAGAGAGGGSVRATRVRLGGIRWTTTGGRGGGGATLTLTGISTRVAETFSSLERLVCGALLLAGARAGTRALVGPSAE